MILEIKIKNFRSYKEETIFTMIPNASEYKIENIAELNDNQIKILKTALIYGANASGKSNIIRALYEIIKLLIHKPKVDEEIKLYDPFIFDIDSKDRPCEFEITFIGPQEIKFNYKIIILKNAVIEEDLFYYPNNNETQLFSRKPYSDNERIQKGVLTEGNKEINVFANQLFLSRFGSDDPHEILTDVYLYFKSSIEIINATNEKHREKIFKEVSSILSEDKELKSRLSKLIRAADTKINDISIHKFEEKHLESLDKDSQNIIQKNPFFVFGIHEVYKDDNIEGAKILPLEEESTGTKSLYSIGGKIVSTIQNGGVLIVDELDTSLHPFITKMIVMIFQSKILNNKNAQLIFTTHDVSLLDKDLIRKDQVWIAEKNKKGISDLYSLQDFEGLSEDTPFEKWYLAGKFGGLPQIKSIESIFESNPNE